MKFDMKRLRALNLEESSLATHMCQVQWRNLGGKEDICPRAQHFGAPNWGRNVTH